MEDILNLVEWWLPLHRFDDRETEDTAVGEAISEEASFLLSTVVQAFHEAMEENEEAKPNMFGVFKVTPTFVEFIKGGSNNNFLFNKSLSEKAKEVCPEIPEDRLAVKVYHPLEPIDSTIVLVAFKDLNDIPYQVE